jgi:hypothetical protein
VVEEGYTPGPRPRPASPTAAARLVAGSLSPTTCDPPRGSSSGSPSPKLRSLCPL